MSGMMRGMMMLLVAGAIGLGTAKPGWGHETQPATAPSPGGIGGGASVEELTVAVLDFTADDPANPELGAQIGETMTILLSGEPGIRLVERTALQRALSEQELSLTGLVETDQAVRVGKLVGARVLVVGKAFRLGDRLFITAKLIGTETSLVDGVLVKSEPSEDTGELVLELAEKVGGRLRSSGSKLVAMGDGTDPVARYQQVLAGRQLPVVAVVVTEEHLTRRRPEAIQAQVDPAVETEVKAMLTSCGVAVKDVEANGLTDWVRGRRQGEREPWPRDLAGVDMVVTGEAFSEAASQLGNLQSSVARVEVNMIDRRSGRIVLADRTTTRAVDLSENVAGRKALEKAGRQMGLRILEHLAEVTSGQAQTTASE